ncbi:MAG TPA: hopanoid biosynthesis-associated protein HpnK [Steroidobacteraceae bacterium]|nr:hopanoid biosynthesis-associated protein HpnK [Steroidobacteraceae bacterium]
MPAPSGIAAGRRFLILTADDFGLHRRVNEAVERAASAGTLTAASLMVGAPAAADAIARAHDLPELRVGLHLVLADGRAVLPPRLIPSLVDSDGFFGNHLFRDAVRYFALPDVRRQVEAEIRAQFEAFAHSGLPLDHVNAHKHLHLHPTLLEIMLRVGAQFGLTAVRLPREPPGFARRCAGLAGTASNLLLAPWLAWMRTHLRGRGLIHNDHVYGIACSGAWDESRLLRVLADLPSGVSEIYLHPATAAPAALSSSMQSYRHSEELDALLSLKVRRALAEANFARGGYSDFLRLTALSAAQS